MSDTSRARRSTASANKTTPDVDDQTQAESARADVVDEVSDASANETTGSSSALLRKAHDQLAERGEPVEIGELARVVFGLGKLPDSALATWAGMLTRIMRASPLFVADEDQRVWRLAAWDLSQRITAGCRVRGAGCGIHRAGAGTAPAPRGRGGHRARG